MRVLPRSIVGGRYVAARTGATWHNGGSRTVAAVRLPGFRDGLSSPSGCSAGMQSPRSAAAVSLPLLQRSGLSASHPDPAASLETADGLSSSPSHLLSSVSTPRQEYCWSGVDAAEAPQFSHAHPSTALTPHLVAGSAGNTGIAGVQLGVLDPPVWAVSTALLEN